MRSNLARKIDGGGAVQEIGQVISAEGARFLVRAEGGDLRSQRAVSCLVEPIWTICTRRLHRARRVVHPRRPGAARRARLTRIEVKGDLQIAAPSGASTVAAQSVELVSAERVSVTAGSFG